MCLIRENTISKWKPVYRVIPINIFKQSQVKLSLEKYVKQANIVTHPNEYFLAELEIHLLSSTVIYYYSTV